MKGDAIVIEGLNEALSEELTAINQYFLHSEMSENWGYEKLSSFIKKQSIEEMKHAEELIERILFLEGMPNMTPRKLNIGMTVPDIIQNDLQLEISAVAMYNRLIAAAAKANDQGTVELLKAILEDEESHVDSLEAEHGKIQDMGVQIYLSTK